MSRGSIFVGRTLKDRRVLTLSNEQRSGHVQIVGATGRGKTVSVIAPWFVRDLLNQNIPILIDGKGDRALADEISFKAKARGFKVDVFDLSDSYSSKSVNPLIGGGPQEIADRLIASLEFDSTYFRDVQHAAVILVLEVFSAVKKVPTLAQIFEVLSNPNQLQDMLRECGTANERLQNEVTRFCAIHRDTREERLSGILSQLRPFASGELAALTGKGEIDLIRLAAGDNTAAAVFLLNSMQFQKTAKILGKLILQTLAWSVAKRSANAKFMALYVDEFSSFVYDGFEQFLNKARSRNVGIHISHQSIGDLEAISSSFAKTVNVNTNVKVLLGLNDPDTADYFARHLGTRSTLKTTERARSGAFGGVERSGEMSLRDVEQYKIHPNRLKNYSQGQGVLSMLVGGISLTEEVQFDRVV
jgi:type IV secretory pathway TraG/TraD family ATPase VirD4